MTKFTEKSLHSFAMAFFYSTTQAFVDRIGAIDTQIERLITMRNELNSRFQAFDTAYKLSIKSQHTKTIADLDAVRDHLAYVIESVARLWATKLDSDELNIHGRRVWQVFKDFQFRTDEALVAENAKVDNMQQRFAEPTLAADLQAMGLTELNRQFAETTSQIKELMSQRNEENATIGTGEVKRTRLALEDYYAQMITYLNAVLEIMPEESISLAAQYYNEDFRKVELQIAQSKKKGSASSSGSGSGGNPTNPTNPTEPGGDTPGGDTPGGSGGDTPGGDTPGGDQPGGDEPGGETPGGDTPGGEEPGGDTPGGETPGGDSGGDGGGTGPDGLDKD